MTDFSRMAPSGSGQLNQILLNYLKARLREPLMVKIFVPADEHSAGAHSGLRHHRISGVDRHDIANSNYVMPGGKQKISNGIRNVDVSQKWYD